MHKLLRFLLYWASTVAALWIVDGVFDSLEFDSLQAMLLSGLVLALVNLTVKPLLLLVTLPLTVLTLGLAIPLINGLVLWVVASLIPGFSISGFWMGVLAALAVSFVSFLITAVTGQSELRGSVYREVKVGRAIRDDDSVIDVEAREKGSKRG